MEALVYMPVFTHIRRCLFNSRASLSKPDVYVKYCMEGNFDGGKPWRIWRMIMDSPNLNQPNFMLQLISDIFDLEAYL